MTVAIDTLEQPATAADRVDTIDAADPVAADTAATASAAAASGGTCDVASPVGSAAPNEVAIRPRPYLAPVPDSLPPFDDDRIALYRLRNLRPRRRIGDQRPSDQHQRSHQHRQPSAAQQVPVQRRSERIISDPTVPTWSAEPGVGVRHTASTGLPAAVRTGQAFARGMVEVLSGRRPMSQLRALCAPGVFAGLQISIVESGSAQLSSVRVCQPADGVAEVAAVFRSAGRARALAFRLQGLDGKWRITALQTG